MIKELLPLILVAAVSQCPTSNDSKGYQLTMAPRTSIIRLYDGAVIPPDLNNVDYQCYQQWTAKGNKADAATQ